MASNGCSCEIEKIISKKINSIKVMRGIRIEMSKRLSGYSRNWSVLFFFLNVQAIIMVLLSLTNTVDRIEVVSLSISFDLLSGMFTLYVILLQYYINALSFDERSLRLHYHQLEIEDLRQKLEMLLINKDSYTKEEIVERYNSIVEKYQLVVKNNENHQNLDYKKTLHNLENNKKKNKAKTICEKCKNQICKKENLCKYCKNKKRSEDENTRKCCEKPQSSKGENTSKECEENREKNDQEDVREEKEKESFKSLPFLFKMDFTLDMIFILVNTLVVVAMFYLIIKGLIIY